MSNVLRSSSTRSLQQQLQKTLSTFQGSNATFQVLKTVNPRKNEVEEAAIPTDDDSPRTLFILDSSFNPPSIAHQALVERALHTSTSNAYPKPHRVLLLFSTMNADKAPSAASFDQRLLMMTSFAVDLIRNMAKEPDNYSLTSIDVGITKAPYYTDKSKAIESEGASWYPQSPRHIHLIGFDTLTRIFAAKYYAKFHPPFSALAPYFDAGHEFRAIMRPDDQQGSLEDQRNFLHQLETGGLESDGGRRDWASKVHLVSPNPKVGISSTKIREAAKGRDWTEVRQLCTPAIAQLVESEGLYEEDDREAKMG